MGVNNNNDPKIPTPCAHGTQLTPDSYIEVLGERAGGLRHHWSEQTSIFAQLQKQTHANRNKEQAHKDEFEQLLFACCESNLKQYSPQIRHEFFIYVLQSKPVLRSLYTYLRCSDVSAEHYEAILENAKSMLQRNIIEPSSELTLHLKSMINHAIYGLAREALACAYEA